MDQILTTTVRRRGHQHHPRHTTRRRLDISSRGPAQCGPTGSNVDNQQYQHCHHSGEFTIDGCSSTTITTITNINDNDKLNNNNNNNYDKLLNNTTIDEKENHHNKIIINEFDNNNLNDRPAQCGQSRIDIKLSSFDNENNNNDVNDNDNNKYLNNKQNEKIINNNNELQKTIPIRSRKKLNPEPEHAVARARGDGHSDDENQLIDEDPEILELAKLRCTSERTEVQSEREARRRKRCADYPGLAFGSSIFSSDTMMKFSLIKNELSNIMGNQLKRVSIYIHIYTYKTFK